jgi:hypothetical protein
MKGGSTSRCRRGVPPPAATASPVQGAAAQQQYSEPAAVRGSMVDGSIVGIAHHSLTARPSAAHGPQQQRPLLPAAAGCVVSAWPYCVCVFISVCVCAVCGQQPSAISHALLPCQCPA